MVRDFFRFLFCVLFSFVILGSAFSDSHSQVLINEVLADPARDWNGDGVVNYRDDEWVEVINAGSTAVSIDSLFIADGDDPMTVRFGFSALGDNEVSLDF